MNQTHNTNLQGSRPVIFFTRYGKNSVRMAVNTGLTSKKSAERRLKWGVKLKLDVNKAVTGLAAHPTASQLLVLFEDGSLRSYALSSTGLQSLWPAGWMLPGMLAFGVWTGVVHKLESLFPTPYEVPGY